MEFRISDMTCGGCLRSVTAAIRTVDPEAQVQGDVDARRVQVTTTAPRDRLASALTDAGFTPA
jgi:copper chaperone